MRSTRSCSAASPVVLLAILSGCGAGGYRSDYQRCLREPASHGQGVSREGYTSTISGLSWGDWGRGAIQPREPVLRLTLSKQDCVYSVQAEGSGTRWKLDGFTYVDDGSFRQDVSGRRVGFTAFDERERAAYAVVDGVKSPPYREILWHPTFSPNGQHTGYLARTDDGAVAIVDGQVAGRARDFHRSVFDVLDDGRFAAAPRLEDGTVEVNVAGVTSPPVDDICDARLPVIRPSGHFAFVGKRGGAYVVIVDGREVPAPGLPAGCEVVFSEDDTRWGWIAIHAGPSGLQSSEVGAVIDGAFRPLPASSAELRFLGGLAVVRTSVPDPSGNSIHGQRKWEKVHWLADLPDPAVPPTEDGYFPPDNGWTVEWARVRIGASVGPRFDRIDWSALFVDERGSVHYIGERGGARLEVVDNVLVSPSQERQERQPDQERQPALQVPAPLPAPDPGR